MRGMVAHRLFYLGFWFGTPELWTGKDDERVTYRASQVHDALCQYAEHLPITRQTASEIFRRMLIDKGVPAWLARIYYFSAMNGRRSDYKGVLNVRNSRTF